MAPYATGREAMANGNSMAAGDATRRWPRWRVIAAVLALLAIAGLVYAWPAMRAYSRTGAAYAARDSCSCRYLGGRTLSDCQKDLEPGMEIVSVSEDPEARRIDASVPLLAHERAAFRPGYGCVLMREGNPAR